MDHLRIVLLKVNSIKLYSSPDDRYYFAEVYDLNNSYFDVKATTLDKLIQKVLDKL